MEGAAGGRTVRGKKKKNIKDTETTYVESLWERSWSTHGNGNGNVGLHLYNTGAVGA